MSRRETILRWLRAGLDAVEPERLTHDALRDRAGPMTVLAIGKAAAAMCRGAASAVGPIEGLCVTTHHELVPDNVELVIGDHPLPGPASLAAGLKALDASTRADIALISGGGSSLCEVPADGLAIEFVASVYEKLLDTGTDIVDVNLVRASLSKTKGGGLGSIPTYVISDVAGAGPSVVSSGPTLGVAPDPDRAIDVMRRVGVTVDRTLEQVIRANARTAHPAPEVFMLADGRTAAKAVALASVGDGVMGRVRPGWIEGDFQESLVDFVGSADRGITVASGEPSVPGRPDGRGGRNTHTALRAAQMISGSDAWFAALATDGVDGRSDSAGAIVDGATLSRGGDPTAALTSFNSAAYLETTGDLIEDGPTGTNVADLWLIWRPERGPEPILSV